MADKRAWAKVDLGYLTNPKMSDILDASSTATLMHLASILHSAQHLTDGHVSPKAMQRAVGGSDADASALIAAGLWHAPGHDCDDCPQPEDGKVYVHDYLEHNRSAEDAEEVSAKRSEAAKKRWAVESMQSASNLHSTLHANSTAKAPETDAGCNAEREKERKERKKGPKRTGPHPLPLDFSVTDDMRAWASEVTPAVDPSRQTADFIYYWTKGGGAGKRKTDWERTWQNNMKAKQKWAEDDGWKPKPPPGKDLSDPKNW